MTNAKNKTALYEDVMNGLNIESREDGYLVAKYGEVTFVADSEQELSVIVRRYAFDKAEGLETKKIYDAYGLLTKN